MLVVNVVRHNYKQSVSCNYQCHRQKTITQSTVTSFYLSNKLLGQEPTVGSGPRYQILSHVFARSLVRKHTDMRELHAFCVHIPRATA